jgi:hypothetical protein
VGALTEVFVATDDAARAFAAGGAPFGPAAEFESAELPGVEVVLLAQLSRALPAAPALERPTPVGESREEGPWVLALPGSLIEALAGLDDESVPAVAARWAAAPEWAPREPQPEILAGALRALAALARRANAQEGAGLYLGWSL